MEQWKICNQVIEVWSEGECLYRLDARLYRSHVKKLQQATDLKAAIAKCEQEVGWRYALRSLERKGLFISELKQKLAQRLISESGCDKIIARAVRYGFLDDERELENSIASGVAKGKGPYRLVLEIQRRSQLSQEKIKELIPNEECEQRARRHVEKYLRANQIQKARAFLARRGFSYDVIQKVLQL